MSSGEGPEHDVRGVSRKTEALKILLIEDDETDQLIFRRGLDRCGRGEFEVVPAATLADAIARIESDSFDAISLDLSLPDSRGLESMTRLAAVTDLPVVVMTGNANEAERLEFIQLGAEDYLVKGELAPQHVAACFQHAVERHLIRRELVEAQRGAELASQSKSAFVASMSHEIRTPLNAIIGMADLLSQADLDADHRQYVEIFQRSGRNLLFLLDNVLELARVEAGKIELVETPFDAAQVVREVIEVFAFAAHKKRIVIAIDVPQPPPPLVRGDVNRLRQVLLNLVGNAVKFTDEGSVVVSLRDRSCGDARALTFEVCDTGPGIAKDAQMELFTPFARASSNAAPKAGTGLGLALCADLVEVMGGSIGLDSDLDQGTRISVDLKLACAGDVAAEAVCRLENKTLWFVQTPSVERELLETGLRQSGATVETFGSTAELISRLEVAESVAPDYAVVDCRVAGGGIELVERLAEQLPTCRSTVLLPMDHRAADFGRCKEVGAARILRPTTSTDVIESLVEDAEPHAALAKQAPGTSGLAKMRILLAEDSEENRFLINAYLAGADCQMSVATNGREALELATRHIFDVILMDLNMPEMDGLEATRRIRAIEAESGRPPVPILALTAYAFSEQAEACREAGCDRHLTKPISQSALLDALETVGVGSLEIDPSHELEALASQYLSQRKSDIGTLESAIDARDFETARTLGHNMKGTGLGYGFAWVSTIGGEIERAAQQEDQDGLTRAVDDLAAFTLRALPDGKPASAAHEI